MSYDLNRRRFCLGLAALPAVGSTGYANGQPAIWDRKRTIRFVLRDPLDHPFYWWPRTLLGYPIEFSQPVDLDRLVLTLVATGERIPFQFSDVVRDAVGLRSATLHFFSDLPSGGEREFVLAERGDSGQEKSQVSERVEGKTIVLDTGAMQIRIPVSQAVEGDAPGPIVQVGRGGRWVGSSSLRIAGDQVVRIESHKTASGPLFLAYEIRYQTAGGSVYAATVQCEGGMDFIRLREDMEGIKSGVHGLFRVDWEGFEVTHRQAPNHPFPLPDEPAPYDQYTWEKIDAPWRSLDIQYGASLAPYPTSFPRGQVPFLLGKFQTWTAFHVGTFANFWSQHGSDALGIFIDKVEEWEDHEYAYEVESPALQVSFYHQDGKFHWEWPVVRGRRSTCLAFYDHEKDKQAMREMERASQKVEWKGSSYHLALTPTSHALFLQNRYGTLDLNGVKDWVLEYGTSNRQPPVIFTMGQMQDGAELEHRIMTSDFISALPLTGTRQNGGHGAIPGRNIVNFSAVPSRQILGWWTDGFNRLSGTMTESARRRLTAMYLFVAYVHAGEEFMPFVTMLSGHPNFISDVKATPAAMAFLFPDHPMASQWADFWEKCVEINTRFNTRPEVKTWDAAGGRWTEDLGTYVWAFLRPSLRTDYLLRQRDGRVRFVTPQLAQMAEWLVRTLSAPFEGETAKAYPTLAKLDGGHDWGVVAPGAGPVRVHPPQGAHAERRTPPRSLWYLGTCLQRYAPMAAEYAMWAARPANQDMETALGSKESWDVMYRGMPENHGTDPHLKSSKFTGYGMVLRSAVGTADEVSVYLQQIDQGPNYRWGVAAEGGCGVIYFFANGKAFSHNSAEDVGDRKDQDTDFCTNFGVFKQGSFHSIGENVLSRPFYNLGFGQLAELVPRANAVCAPEYLSRSILLAGSDYFLLHDAVVDATVIHRLSWFVRKGDDLPQIHMVNRIAGDGRETQRTDHQTDATTGVWFDGSGDSMVVVSHRKDLVVEAKLTGCRVHTAEWDDLVFRSSTQVRFTEAGMVFEGTCGLIRRMQGGYRFALFHGTRIGVPGLVLSTEDTELGLAGSLIPGDGLRGMYYAPQSSSVHVSGPLLAEHAVFYIDGEAKPTRRGEQSVTVDLAAGHHHWEFAEGVPVPMAPKVLRTENHHGGARVFLQPTPSTTRYRLELSVDGGAVWTTAVTQQGPIAEIQGLANGSKVHVRAIALNALHESAAGEEYPVYVTNQAPPPPDGLRVALADGQATITWGEILGVVEYRLYARSSREKNFRLIYHGLERVYLDRRAEIWAAHARPGASGAASDLTTYCVTASNGNGESTRSSFADTDPTSWRNWDPRPGEPFRRVYGFQSESPQPADGEQRYYPD